MGNLELTSTNVSFWYGTKFVELITEKKIFLNEKFGWPMAILFLAPVEGWKGPAGNLWPYLIYSSLEGFRKFLEKK